MYMIPQADRERFDDALFNRENVPITLRCNRLSMRRIRCFDDILLACREIHAGTMWNQNRGKHFDDDALPTLVRLAEHIYNYFNHPSPNVSNTQNNFDWFHKRLCFLFLNWYRSIQPLCKLVTYGNTQKLINMVFKYLSCYSDYEDFSGLFSYCHMPIDRKILNKLQLEGVPCVCNCAYNGVCWTKFDYEQYDALVSAYRSKIPQTTLGEHTYLELEYVLWPTSGRLNDLLGRPSGMRSSALAIFYM